MANEKAKNNLESYIFETQAWLEVEEVIAVSSEEQREEIRAAIREVYDWFEEEGYYSAETKVSLHIAMHVVHSGTIDIYIVYIVA